jgi:phosphoribosylformylglycinamidine (FGAM) synthase PurS component
MKYGIKIMPRDVILDTQGRVVGDYLKSKGYVLNQCRVGKFIEIEFDGTTDIENNIEKMMSEGLYNSLTEKYEIING